MHKTQTLTKKPPRPVFDRGPRPYMRGRLHTAAAWYFGGMGTALTIVAASKFHLSWMTFATALYALCLAGMLTVCLLYTSDAADE